MATYLGHQEDSSGNILLPTPHSMATQIEFGTTASQAYAKGAYVVFNNRLCKASTAIASGDTLAIGTNLVQCSIGSELNSHLQAPNGNEFYFDYKDNKPGFYPSASKVASEFVPFGGSTEITLYDGNKTRTNIDISPYSVSDFDSFIIYTRANSDTDSWIDSFKFGLSSSNLIQHWVRWNGINYCMNLTLANNGTILGATYYETNGNMGLGITKVIGVK